MTSMEKKDLKLEVVAVVDQVLSFKVSVISKDLVTLDHLVGVEVEDLNSHLTMPMIYSNMPSEEKIRLQVSSMMMMISLEKDSVAALAAINNRGLEDSNNNNNTVNKEKEVCKDLMEWEDSEEWVVEWVVEWVDSLMIMMISSEAVDFQDKVVLFNLALLEVVEWVKESLLKPAHICKMVNK